jgi:hypothetical protein
MHVEDAFYSKSNLRYITQRHCVVLLPTKACWHFQTNAECFVVKTLTTRIEGSVRVRIF